MKTLNERDRIDEVTPAQSAGNVRIQIAQTDFLHHLEDS
jgi:hypothetical protein